MPARYDRHVGSIEILEPERTSEGFLKVHGILARCGVLRYMDGNGNVSAELIPPDELFKPSSLATIGGKPFTDDHPRDDDGAALLVTPDNSQTYTKGTIGNEIRGDHKLGFVRITIDVHDADTIAKIDAGKRELSSGRTVGRIDQTPGVWDHATQTYWIGDEAKGKRGIQFDAIQRDYTHNHGALVTRGRAGNQVALRMDSDDAMQVPSSSESKATNGGQKMARIRIDGAEYEVESGTAAAFVKYQGDVKVKADAMAAMEVELEARLVKADGAKDVIAIQLKELQAKMDAYDPRAAVVARLELERSVAKLKIDGMSSMSDRDLKIAAIKLVKADYASEGVSDDHVGIYFDAMLDLIGRVKAVNDGSGAVSGALKTDSDADSAREKRRVEFAQRGSFNTLNKGA